MTEEKDLEELEQLKEVKKRIEKQLEVTKILIDLITAKET